jgi:hypothetical protein
VKVQIVTSYRVSYLQRDFVAVSGNVTSVYPLKKFYNATIIMHFGYEYS